MGQYSAAPVPPDLSWAFRPLLQCRSSGAAEDPRWVNTQLPLYLQIYLGRFVRFALPFAFRFVSNSWDLPSCLLHFSTIEAQEQQRTQDGSILSCPFTSRSILGVSFVSRYLRVSFRFELLGYTQLPPPFFQVKGLGAAEDPKWVNTQLPLYLHVSLSLGGQLLRFPS